MPGIALSAARAASRAACCVDCIAWIASVARFSALLASRAARAASCEPDWAAAIAAAEGAALQLPIGLATARGAIVISVNALTPASSTPREIT